MPRPEPPDGDIAGGPGLGESVFVHPSAIVETTDIGPGTRIWAFSHILNGVRIGRDCNIGGHCYVEGGARIGHGVTVKNGNAIWEGVELEDGVFVAPGVVFTNDRYPRSPRSSEAERRYGDKEWLEETRVCEGATIGAGAIILPGLTIGPFAFVAAGALVTRDISPYALVSGSPARPVAWVCRCGAPLRFERGEALCSTCQRRFRRDGDAIAPMMRDGTEDWSPSA
jgi:UDP-2-acetamido-3-amino-2,3-dideoxy-glucuronate N-acetyltransferase